ncbi:MAG: nuclear transport factor 2 family protein [Lachnospiraceae bacterium]|nr:nuclear transport factor 2 family protein [Lachnospiraceae bacterium]
MSDKEQIQELYKTYWKYMIDKDAQGLREIMASDYYLMHMTGVKQSKEVFIKGLLDGTFNYYSAEHDSIEVTVDGDNARMVGKSRVLAAVYGGGKNRWRLQGDFTLRKEAGEWKLTSSKASTY